MKIPERGLARSEIRRRLGREARATEGTVPRMFDIVHQLSALPKLHRVAEDALLMFMESTADETAELESELVSMVGELWHGKGCAGNMTSGGTESNFTAMRAAVKLSGGKRGSVVVPNTVHRSIPKANDWLGLETIYVPVDEHADVSPENIRRALRKDTIAISTTCGTNPYGGIDPIREIGEIAESRGLYLHVDAAFGGLYCPWVERLGRAAPAFDFRVKGVCSIASDPHKSGYGVYPAGCIVFRDEETRRAASFDTTNLPLGYKSRRTFDPGLLGGRPAIGIAVAWAVFNHLGAEGYLGLTRMCEASKDRFVRSLEGIAGLEPVAESHTNLLAVMSREFDLAPIKDELRRRGWAFAGSNGEARTHRSNILIVFAPANEPKYDPFLEDLRAVSTRAQVG